MADKVLSGFCPNAECGAQMFFLANATEKECLKCSELHDIKSIKNVQPVTDHGAAIRMLLQSFKQSLDNKLQDHFKSNSESIKVKGLSNYSAKLLSPLLTIYGLDKKTQTVKLLSEMGQGESFDCSLLSDRAFLIEPDHLFIKGYGKIDIIAEYLKETLQQIYNVNGGEENIIPVYVDSDGHCLLHAISRALVGREIFWHPFSTNLKAHFKERKQEYMLLFKDFIEDDEWADIIAEADPDFSQSGEIFGLRNIHIFGLANCLHRPIILIDSAEGMYSKGDYCGVFLPYLIPIEKCRDSHGVLNKPILISWSNKGRNHFVPLVGIQGKQVPKFPAHLLPKVWGLPQDLLHKYIDFDKGCCIIGGSKSLSDRYLTKLINAMENHFRLLKGIAPSVVTDVYHHICKKSAGINLSEQDVIDTAYSLAKEERLRKCLICQSVMEEVLPFPLNWLFPGGKLYDIAVKTHKILKNKYHYRFPEHNSIVCEYDEKNNRLIYVNNNSSLTCKNCEGPVRVLKADGSISYIDGDQLPFKASKASKCGCGYKHFWGGKHYDNLPVRVPILLEWGGKKISDFIFWFQYEEDDMLNSNAFEIAQNLVQKHFPGEFGSERLVEKVVDQIFCYVLDSEPKDKSVQCLSKSDSYYGGNPETTLNKIILQGAKSKTLHKEELNMSKQEEKLRKKIEYGATVKQKRLSGPSSPQKVSNMSPEKLEEIKSDVKKFIPSNNCRIRISMIGGKNETFTISSNTTYVDIQNFVEEKFDVSKSQQLIKFGYPPKTLNSFNISELKAGDRLVVHIQKKVDKPLNDEVPLSEDAQMKNSTNITNDSGTSNQSTQLTEENYKSIDHQKNAESSGISFDQGLLSDSLFALLRSVDLWEWACTQRELFRKGSIFFNRASLDLGVLQNNQHVTLPCFPQKVFSYSESEAELHLCLGQEHIPIKVLTDKEVMLAKNVWLELENKGVIFHNKKGKTSNFHSFSGKGYSLSNIEEVQNNETNTNLSIPPEDISMTEDDTASTSRDDSLNVFEKALSSEFSNIETPIERSIDNPSKDNMEVDSTSSQS